MRRILAGPLGLIAAACLPLPAAELAEVVVTANRVAQPLEAGLAATTVFTREDIAASQARSVEDLLRGVEGLAIGNNGGPGKLTSFFVRGTDADHLLVLVDGVRIGSATAGTAALQNIPVELIERIEFVRGPRSSLYGPEAVGGVLQVFTRGGAGAWRPEVQFGGGSFDTRQASLALGGGGERAWLHAQGAWQRTDGFDACGGSSSLGAGCFAEEPDRDGYRYRSASLRAGGRLAAGTQIDASFLRAAGRVEYDGPVSEFYTGPDVSRIVQQVAGAALTQDLAARGQLELRLGRAWDASDDYRDDAFISDFRTRRDSASLQWNIAPRAGQLFSLGADWQHEDVAGNTGYTVESRDNAGLYAQYVGETGPWRIEASLRGDDNEQFGRHATGSAAVGYAVNGAMQLLAQYGTGFRSPSFNDLYYPFFGNASLDPETSRSLELALRGRLDAARWRVSLFDTRIRDLIALDGNFLPANIETARIRGLEAGIVLPWRDWRLDAGFTLLDAEDRSSGTNRGNDLARRPRLAGRLDVERRFGGVTLGARWTGEGRRFDDPDNERRVGGYGTLDLTVDAALAGHWRVQLRAANVTDRRYETVAFYNQPGRALYLTVRYAGGE